MNFDLRRMSAVLAALGHPERSFIAVHVAGTNGKGSVCALIAAALRESGLRVGLYTSPHLERINERFRVNGREASTAEISRLSSRVRAAFRSVRLQPTQFEFLTAIAFLYFARQRVAIAVVEVGLGGRLDATNALEHVAVSVITNIGLDHVEWLGKTEERIAGEKAGIVRPRVPLVTGASGAALGVISRVARERGASITVVDRPLPSVPPTRFTGPHQRRNAAVAFAALRALRGLGLALPEAAVRRGFARAEWPGRFERFTTKAGQNRISWILDGAHNVPAARALAESLKSERIRRVELLFGALRDKDYVGIARELAPLADSVTTVAVSSSRAASARDLARLGPWRKRARPSPALGAALSEIVRRRPLTPVLVTGSLYLVGSVRAWMRGQGRVG
jgi:dihydrofolate synthase / folylpolyglutamate synthase